MMENNLKVPYEKELIENLRDKYFLGLPLSIIVLFKPFCRNWCHYMSAQLSRGFANFNYVNAHLNCLDDPNDINHSWIENDDYVYDVTDCMKWKRDIYYEVYKPRIISICNQDEVFDNPLYKVGYNMKDGYFDCDIELLIEMIELYEDKYECDENNKKMIIGEIKLFKKKNNLKKQYYHKYVEQKVNNIFRKWC